MNLLPETHNSFLKKKVTGKVHEGSVIMYTSITKTVAHRSEN
jgi:hypothetical protein